MSLILKAHQFHRFFPLRTTPDCELDIERKPEWGVDAGQVFWI
jgi:hypothetical protein